MKKNKIKSFIKEPIVIISLSCIVLILMIILVVLAVDTFEKANYVPKGGQSAAEIMAEENLEVNNEIGKQKVSLGYSSLEANYKEWNSEEENLKNGIYCITTDATTNIVFNIDSNNVATEGKTFSDYSYMWINSGCDDFYAIVNISGKDINLQNYSILTRDESGVYGSRALLNFYEAENIDISNCTIIGNILAPYATVKCDNTYLYGQINSKEIVGELAYHKSLTFAGYKTISADFETVTFVNDSVRIAAIEYLVNNDTENQYKDYKSTSSFKLNDVNAVEKIYLNMDGKKLTNIEDDLAVFPFLKEIIIKNADIESFSLEKLPQVKALTITDSKISSLNIKSALELEKLVIDNNPLLKALDFTSNIQLRVLSYANTPLGWMDYTCLPELYYLDCSGAQVQPNLSLSGSSLPKIKMLDISNNSNIITVYLNTFKNLEKFNCSYCPIKTLDFNGCDKLNYFKGSHIRINEFDFKPAKALEKIEVFGENVKKIDITDLELTSLFYDGEIEIIGEKLNKDNVGNLIIKDDIVYDSDGNIIPDAKILRGVLINGQIVDGVILNGEIIYVIPEGTEITDIEDNEASTGDEVNQNGQ